MRSSPTSLGKLGLPGEELVTPAAAAAVLGATEALVLSQVLIANREQWEEDVPLKALIPCSSSRGEQPSPLMPHLASWGVTHPGAVDKILSLWQNSG